MQVFPWLGVQRSCCRFLHRSALPVVVSVSGSVVITCSALEISAELAINEKAMSQGSKSRSVQAEF